MLPDAPDEQPEWAEDITGEVKSNGSLHIWSTEQHNAVITSDYYVRPEHDAVT